MYIPDNERIDNPCDYMAKLALGNLPLDHWGFKESYRSEKEERLVFDSKWCRVQFIWVGWEIYTGYNMRIFYGRLHAPVDAQSMSWEGEECDCWHTLMGAGDALDFLNGLTPEESIAPHDVPILENLGRNSWWDEIAADKRRVPELTIKKHAVIWEYYGTRLLELFDLRRPEIWKHYREWLLARYKAEGKDEDEQRKKFGISIPYYRVC